MTSEPSLNKHNSWFLTTGSSQTYSLILGFREEDFQKQEAICLWFWVTPFTLGLICSTTEILLPLFLEATEEKKPIRHEGTPFTGTLQFPWSDSANKCCHFPWVQKRGGWWNAAFQRLLQWATLWKSFVVPEIWSLWQWNLDIQSFVSD